MQKPQLDLQELDVLPASEAWDGPMQMAVDEALLRHAPRAALRFYRWTRPQLTFGYFGSYCEVRKKHPALPATRRWTGGGIVLHGGDLTFSLALPAGHPAVRLKGAEFYCAIHGAIAAALGQCGIFTRLATVLEQQTGVECFRAPVAGDVLSGTRKLAGGAIRRTREGILYQGSVHGPLSALQRLIKVLPELLSGSMNPRELTPGERSQAGVLAAGRYGLESWLKLR